jgi:hypothetical protein
MQPLTIIESSKFSRYGTVLEQEYLRTWAKEKWPPPEEKSREPKKR